MYTKLEDTLPKVTVAVKQNNCSKQLGTESCFQMPTFCTIPSLYPREYCVTEHSVDTDVCSVECVSVSQGGEAGCRKHFSTTAKNPWHL